MHEKNSISILGDSISTFADYSPQIGVFYKPEFGSVTGINCVEDTWWAQLIKTLNGSLLVNDSWAGSTVSAQGRFPAVAIPRLRRLAIDGSSPDIILFWSGLNDVMRYVPADAFAKDYDTTVKRLKEYYPNALILCATLIMGYTSGKDTTSALEKEYRLPSYNSAIRESAVKHGGICIDLEKLPGRYESIDGFHPNKTGMIQVSDLWIQAIMSLPKDVQKKMGLL